jgi:hypothetical protein
MKKLAIVTSVLCSAIFVASCSPSNSATGAINPGDKIGKVLITTGDAESITKSWELDCPDENTAEPYHCNLPVGEKINVSWGTYGDQGTDMETMWAEHTHQIYINDRPVNLEAFGTQDVVHPHVGKMRYWNVVILASAPGEISIRNAGVVDGEPFDSTAIFSFSAP